MEAYKGRRTAGNVGFTIASVYKESHTFQDYHLVTDGLHGNITLESMDFRDGDCITFELQNDSEQPEVQDTEEQQEE